MGLSLLGFWGSAVSKTSGVRRQPSSSTSDNAQPREPIALNQGILGRAFGHFIFSLIGLKRILFTNIFQKL